MNNLFSKANKRDVWFLSVLQGSVCYMCCQQCSYFLFVNFAG